VLTLVGLAPWWERLTSHTMASLVQGLGAPTDPMPWARVATISLVAQRDPTIDLDAWRSEVLDRVPDAVAPYFAEVDSTWLLARRPPGAPAWFGLWAAFTPSAAKSFDPSGFRVLAWLDDPEAARAGKEFQETWNAFHHLFHLLQALPHAWFLTSTGATSCDYATLALLRAEEAPEAAAEPWTALEVEDAFRPLLEALAPLSLPLPEVGVDLPDDRGHSSGIEGELVWEDLRVAVVEELGEGDLEAVAAGWVLHTLAELLEDIEPLNQSITRAGGAE